MLKINQEHFDKSRGWSVHNFVDWDRVTIIDETFLTIRNPWGVRYCSICRPMLLIYFKEVGINCFWHYWQSFHTRGSISRSQENVLSNTSNIFRLTTFNRALKLLISFDKSMMECWHIKKINDILRRNHEKLNHNSRDIMQ